MRENDIILLENLWGEFTKSIPLFFELITSLGSGSVDAENNWLLLVAVSEGVKNSVTLALVVLVIEHVAAVSPSCGVGDFVVEKSARHTSSPLFKSKPLENVWLLSLSNELHRSPL